MRPYTYTWLPATGNETTICNAYTLPTGVVDVVLPLNSNEFFTQLPSGAYVFQSLPPFVPGESQTANVYRSLSFTSEEDLSDFNITITGMYLTLTTNADTSHNLVIQERTGTEVLVGPNADTVESVNFFKRIDKIEITLNAAPPLGSTLSVGFGSSGITDPIFIDYYVKYYDAGIQVNVQTADAGTYTIMKSNTDVYVPQTYIDPNSFYLPNPIVCFDLDADTTGANTSKYVSDVTPGTIIFMYVDTNTTAQYTFTYTQVGKQ